METCALNSTELSFLPYMDTLRDSEQYSDKQLAYIGVLHGFSMAWLGESIDPSICTVEFSAEMIREATQAQVNSL